MAINADLIHFARNWVKAADQMAASAPSTQPPVQQPAPQPAPQPTTDNQPMAPSPHSRLQTAMQVLQQGNQQQQ